MLNLLPADRAVEQQLAYFFRQWREWAGLTQGQLAKIVGLSRGTISRIESDERAFTSDFLKDFCQVVGCSTVADPLIRTPDGPGVGRLSENQVVRKQQMLHRAREIRKAHRESKAKAQNSRRR